MDMGIRVGKKRVARLIREMNICGVSRRKSTQTTVKARQANKAPDLVKRDFCSDQGAQYTSIAFGKRCREAGVRPSMGTAGDCYDNAMCESFFSTLECELIDRRSFRTHKEARLAIFSYIEGWYNPHRRHSSIAYHAPIAYEKLHQEQT